MKERRYSHYAYDANFVLKVPLHLWVIIIWSVHHSMFILLGGFSSGDILKSALEYGGHFPLLMSNLPGFLIIAARMNRHPEAGAKTRWIWSNGRRILAAGLGMQLGAIFLVHGMATVEMDNAISWAVAITLLLVFILLKSQYIAETFADFPAPKLDQDKK